MSICECHDDIIRSLIGEGNSYKAVADSIGMKKETVKSYCKSKGYRSKVKPSQKPNKFELRERLKAVSDAFEYIGGYDNSHSKIQVRCNRCGEEYETRIGYLEKRGCCIKCDQIRKWQEAWERAETEAEQKRQEREAKQFQKEMERRKELDTQRQERMHSCPVCGIVTDRKKYCSDKCRRKAENKTREMRRRIKIRAAMVDPDITLEGLYKRDEGRCYICGMQTLLTDYVTKDGTQICGDWYPSIDHVVPLSHGGLHSWANVKLAHRRCNYKKGDSM